MTSKDKKIKQLEDSVKWLYLRENMYFSELDKIYTQAKKDAHKQIGL